MASTKGGRTDEVVRGGRSVYGFGGSLGASRCLVRDTADMTPRPTITSAPTMIQVCGTWSKKAP